jgi:anti-sigma factor RsiW
MNNCIDSGIQEMLPDLAHGTLDEPSRIRVEAHLASCESCREDLAVIYTVKNAAVFAPTIDVQRVVRQIPPYRAIVPGVQAPARSRVTQWLVAAGFIGALVSGGSLLMSRQDKVTATSSQVAGATATREQSDAATPYVPATGPSSSLAFAGNIDDLSDSSLVQLMADMSQFDALPATEPEPVFAMDGGEGQ